MLLLISTAGFAQHFDFGIKGGVNVSNFTGGSGASDVKASSYVGFHAGVFVGLYLGNNFSINPEVQFSTQGAKVEQTGVNKTDYKLTYINVPIMAKYRFNGGFYVEAGPNIGFNVHESYGGTASDFAKSTQLGLVGGLGFHSSMGLGIGARYGLPLSKVGDFDASTANYRDFKNAVIQVSIFYTIFNGNKK